MPIILPFKGILPKIADSAFIAEDAVLIGDIEVGPQSSIWYGCVLRADVNVIRIGARTNIQDGTVIHCTKGGQGTHVGDGVTVGHMALLHDCVVEDNAFVGMKSCMLDKSSIASGGMLAAAGVLTPGKRVPAGELWAGNPAKLMRPLRPEELENFPRSAAHYMALAEQFRNA